ncbi:MAG: tetratricopeptide repeat protein [Cyclobacteriaceae bacterium]
MIISGTTPLNVNKKSLSGFLDSVMQNTTPDKALQQFDKLIKNPGLSNSYEMTYSNKRAMAQIGKDPISAERTKDAIRYFEYFSKLYPSFANFHLELARAYLQDNQRSKAIQALEMGIDEMYDEDKEEARKLLIDIKNK